MVASFGEFTDLQKHYKHKIHIDVLQIMREQGSIRIMQFNTLKILDTVLGFISVGQFSQSTVTGV
jgi:hypothetical protein